MEKPFQSFLSGKDVTFVKLNLSKLKSILVLGEKKFHPSPHRQCSSFTPLALFGFKIPRTFRAVQETTVAAHDWVAAIYDKIEPWHVIR